MRSEQHKPSVDLDRSAVSRYIQLAGLFRRRIETGDWAIGQQTPTVDDLTAECGVARATVRKALDMLEEEGLIELLAAREEAVIEVLSDERGFQPPNVPHPVGTLAPSYRRLTRRHQRHGAPFLLARLYIDERLSKRLSKKDLQSKTALRLMADIPGLKIKDARQTLTIGSADVETSEFLDVPLNAPIGVVYRSVVDRSGCLVFIGEGLYRGDMIRIDMKLK
jgi:GntR family transcriptional regulator